MATDFKDSRNKSENETHFFDAFNSLPKIKANAKSVLALGNEQGKFSDSAPGKVVLSIFTKNTTNWG